MMATQELSVDQSMVDNMLRDQRFLAAFPFLKQARARAARGHNCCGRSKRKKASKPDYNQIKRQLANMPPGKKARLKTLLNAGQVRIKFRRPESQVEVIRKF